MEVSEIHRAIGELCDHAENARLTMASQIPDLLAQYGVLKVQHAIQKKSAAYRHRLEQLLEKLPTTICDTVREAYESERTTTAHERESEVQVVTDALEGPGIESDTARAVAIELAHHIRRFKIIFKLLQRRELWGLPLESRDDENGEDEYRLAPESPPVHSGPMPSVSQLGGLSDIS
ncbi:MAG: hypothetical protein AAB489_02175 [Patescibacteria group bacterium]